MKIFKKLAAYCVTLYARRLYNQAREKADSMYRRKPQMYFVASQTFHPDTLTIYDRVRFKTEKSAFGCHARLLTLISLRDGCYYHTPDTAGNQAMSEREVEYRRRCFIRERLKKARLV